MSFKSLEIKDLEVGDIVKINGTWFVISDFIFGYVSGADGFCCYSQTSRRAFYEEDLDKIENIKRMHEMDELPNLITKIDELLDVECSVKELKNRLRALLYESR